MNKSSWIIIACLIILLIIAGYFAYRSITKQQDNALESSPAAAAFITNASSTGYTDLQGNAVSLEAYLGTPVIAHSWASWVPTSPQSLKQLSDLQEQYPDQSIIVVAINRSEPYATALSFLRQVNATSVTLIADVDDQYYSTIGGRTMPETVFYRADGTISHHQRGTLNPKELAYFADQLVESEE